MTEMQIAAAEARFGLAFPPDYRLFLSVLHTPDPEMIGARFEDTGLVPTRGREFPDWTGEPAKIESAIAWPLESLVWSIEHSEEWHPAWGARPRGRQQREALIRELAAAGPQLIPVFGHRYLVGPSDRRGNPVLSIYGSDVIVYAADLHSYLPLELGLDPGEVSPNVEPPVESIDFWQDVIDGLSWHFA